jgi:glycosyltransferase involved in cell wall biosynthesis
MNPNITVAICTWNRAKLLDRTLARMRDLKIPSGLTWELLVVNNNGTDDTDAVVKSHESALPLRLLHEPKQGHSNARNCAVENTRGELLIWTDDDVLVDPEWLAEYAAAADRFPEAGYFGGTVDPWFEVAPPAWVKRNLPALEGPFALRSFGPEVRPLKDGERVFGASMAFRTALLREHQFNPALGRNGTGMLSGDETDLVDRLVAQGRFGVWVGTARVQHFVPADRMTREYLWSFFHGLGRSDQRRKPYDAAVPMLFGVPRWLVKRYLADRFREALLAPGRGPRWLAAFMRAAVSRGVIDEFRARRSREGLPCS